MSEVFHILLELRKRFKELPIDDRNKIEADKHILALLSIIAPLALKDLEKVMEALANGEE